jgi:hypothetical protein
MSRVYRDTIESEEFCVIEVEPSDCVTHKKLAKELYGVFQIPVQEINWNILRDYLCSWWTDKDNYCFRVKKSAYIQVKHSDVYEDLIKLLTDMQ